MLSDCCCAELCLEVVESTALGGNTGYATLTCKGKGRLLWSVATGSNTTWRKANGAGKPAYVNTLPGKSKYHMVPRV